MPRMRRASLRPTTNPYLIKLYAPFKRALPIPTTDVFDNPTIQLCLNAEWAAYLLGALEPLRWDDLWQGSDLAAKEHVLGQVQALMFALTGEGSCDMLVDVRQNTGSPCLLQKTDDGETWVTFANLQKCPPKLRLGPTGGTEYSTDDGETWTPIDTPPIPVRVPVEGQDDKCLAAANAVEVMRQTWLEFDRLFGTGATPYVIAAGIISLLAIIIFYPPAFAAVLVFFLELYALMSSITGDDFDSDKQDELRCILYCASEITDGVVTFNFSEVYDQVHSMWTPVVNYNVWTAMDYLLNIVGSDGLNRAGATTAVTEATCDCVDCPAEWCYVFDFTVNSYFDTNDSSGWTPPSFGAWTSAGWDVTSGYNAGINYYADIVSLHLTLPAGVYTSAEIEFYWVSGNNPLGVYLGVNGDFVDANTFSGNSVFANSGTWTNPTEVNIQGITSFTPGSPGATGQCLITKCTLRGTGSNPFGTDNC